MIRKRKLSAHVPKSDVALTQILIAAKNGRVHYSLTVYSLNAPVSILCSVRFSRREAGAKSFHLLPPASGGADGSEFASPFFWKE
jgi:hypothetical protein